MALKKGELLTKKRLRSWLLVLQGIVLPILLLSTMGPAQFLAGCTCLLNHLPLIHPFYLSHAVLFPASDFDLIEACCVSENSLIIRNSLVKKRMILPLPHYCSTAIQTSHVLSWMKYCPISKRKSDKTCLIWKLLDKVWFDVNFSFDYNGKACWQIGICPVSWTLTDNSVTCFL